MADSGNPSISSNCWADANPSAVLCILRCGWHSNCLYHGNVHQQRRIGAIDFDMLGWLSAYVDNYKPWYHRFFYYYNKVYCASASSISFFSVEISRRLVIVGYLDKRQQYLVGSLGDAIDPCKIGWAGGDLAFLPEMDDASGLPAFQSQSFEILSASRIGIKREEFVNHTFFLVCYKG